MNLKKAMGLLLALFLVLTYQVSPALAVEEHDHTTDDGSYAIGDVANISDVGKSTIMEFPDVPVVYSAQNCGIGACTCTGSCHTVYSNYSYYNETTHTMSISCSSCGASAMFGGSEGHIFSGNTCTKCGYSRACSHSSTTRSWITGCTWKDVCTSCGQIVASGTSHGPYTYGSWTYYNAAQHSRSYTCSYGDSETYYETANHSATTQYAQYDSIQHAVSSYCIICGSAVGSTTYADHTDADGDGSCDACAYGMTRFSVTVPASLTMTVSQYGIVHVATSAAIVNNSTGAVRVTAITVNTENGWTLAPYDANMATAKVDTKQIGFMLNGAKTTADGGAEQLDLDGDWTIARGGTLPLLYDAVVSAMSAPVDEQVLTLVFVLDWAG